MDETISQYLYKPVYNVGNTLNLIKNIGKKTYKIHFSTAYSHRPHSLSVTPANYFGNDQMASLEQQVVSKDFVSLLRSSYGLRIGNVMLDYSIWGKVDVRGMDTELTGTDTKGMLVPATDSLKNDLWYNTYQVGLTQNYTYQTGGKFKASFSLPVVNYTLTVDDRIQGNTTRYNRWIDLLQGRYGIATQNIAAKDVSTVQVMENHQPIKALKDKAFSDAAAINLKLKDSAKGTLTLTALAGAGYKPVLWNAELVAMYFAAGKQNISTYKGNNSGWSVAPEFRVHYEDERVRAGEGSPLSITEPSTPPVASKRFLYNTSNSVSSNLLFKINKDMELTVNTLYYNDRMEKEGYSLSEQFFPGDTSLRIDRAGRRPGRQGRPGRGCERQRNGQGQGRGTVVPYRRSDRSAAPAPATGLDADWSPAR